MTDTDRLSTPDGQHTTPAITFDQYVSYEDSAAIVICDRSNAAAWIRSTDPWSCTR